jgi:hypothetical protein
MISYVVETDYFDDGFIKIRPCPEKYFFSEFNNFIIHIRYDKVHLINNKIILSLLLGDKIKIELAKNLLK